MKSGTERLNIYFAGAIRGGRQDAGRYARFLEYLGRFGRVLTAHVGDEGLLRQEKTMSEREIFARDLRWLREADLLVAEVSTPSLGVGYEIGVAEALGKPMLCLHRPGTPHALSAMIAGNPALTVCTYQEDAEAEELMARWLATFKGGV